MPAAPRWPIMSASVGPPSGSSSTACSPAGARYVPKNAFARFLFPCPLIKRDVEPFGTVQSIKCFPEKYFDTAVDDPHAAARKENPKLSHVSVPSKTMTFARVVTR